MARDLLGVGKQKFQEFRFLRQPINLVSRKIEKNNVNFIKIIIKLRKHYDKPKISSQIWCNLYFMYKAQTKTKFVPQCLIKF